MDYEELEPADIVVVDERGKPSRRPKPSIETPLHTTVYRKRKDVGRVVHTHSVFATAWASCDVEFTLVAAELAALVAEPENSLTGGWVRWNWRKLLRRL